MWCRVSKRWSGKRGGIPMDSLITVAASALAAGDPLGALNRVALRKDAPALQGGAAASAKCSEAQEPEKMSRLHDEEMKRVFTRAALRDSSGYTHGGLASLTLAPPTRIACESTSTALESRATKLFSLAYSSGVGNDFGFAAEFGLPAPFRLSLSSNSAATANVLRVAS